MQYRNQTVVKLNRDDEIKKYAAKDGWVVKPVPGEQQRHYDYTHAALKLPE